jgi:hypothetical protein
MGKSKPVGSCRSDGLFVCPEAVTIPSTSSRPDRDRLVRDFVKKAEKVHDGEVVLVIVRT